MPDYPNFGFEIDHRDPASGARTGRLTTPHGTIETPSFIFCGTKAAIKGVTPQQMRDAGTGIVLANTYHLMIQPGADRVAKDLKAEGVRAAAIHGDLPQKARERALQQFAEGKLAVLVATDVAARGIDIDDIGAVVHYEPAKDVKDYLHRSGRTARAGRDGWAVTLVEYNQHTQMRILQRGMRLPSDPAVEVFSNNPNLRDLALFGADATT